MILETERLILRRMTLADAPLILELLTDPAFVRFVADRGLKSEADAATYITEKILPSFEKHGFGFYVAELKDTHEPVGMCGLIKRDTLDDVDIGFSIRRSHWRRGFGYEAANGVMKYARETLGLRRIVGIANPENANSIKLLEKLGLRFERQVRLPGYEHVGNLFG